VADPVIVIPGQLPPRVRVRVRVRVGGGRREEETL